MKILEFHKGDTRNVILLFPLNIVLKFPRIDLLIALRTFKKIISLYCKYLIFKDPKIKKNLDFWIKNYLKGHYEQKSFVASINYSLFRGIMANQNEYLFYKENFENPLLIPTYFSFFGLINIQLLGKPLQNSSLYIFHEIDCLVKESKEITKIEPHQWTEKNFVEFSNKTIALCDYGSLQAFAIIEKYGDEISKISVTAS